MPAGNSEFDVKTVPDDCFGKRLDRVLVSLYPDFSRSRLQSLLKAGLIDVTGVDGARIAAEASMRVQGGEQVQVLSVPAAVSDVIEAQPVALDVIFEDEHLFVINKSANLVMHPAAGNRDHTVQNGLLYRDESLRELPRAGIVHRLDKDTTGLFVVARSHLAYNSLVAQLQRRSMGRNYVALVHGQLIAGGTIDKPIGRHPVDRLRMSVRDNGKPAVTHYRIRERFASMTLLDVKLETGRTHQIRVHLASQRHPLVGDAVYGGRRRQPPGLSEEVGTMVRDFPRQALHAHTLSLIHPVSAEEVSWSVALPDDFSGLLAKLPSPA